MHDPYSVLGVSRAADEAAIKTAYRQLAKKYHPDNNGGNGEAAQAFARVSSAYDLLSDKARRGRFDRGEIDADGKETFRGFNPFGGKPHGQATSRAGAEDIFSDLFESLRPGTRRQAARRGRDVTGRITLTFEEAARGGRQRLSLGGGKTVDVAVPAGVMDGQQIRLKGQGEPGSGGGPQGDALIAVSVRPHPLFERDANDLRLELPVALYEAALGAKVRVPTLDGSVELKIPANSSSGRTLRLKGKGLKTANGAAGDLLVSLRIMLPDHADGDFRKLMESWREDAPYDVRGSKFRNN